MYNKATRRVKQNKFRKGIKLPTSASDRYKVLAKGRAISTVFLKKENSMLAKNDENWIRILLKIHIPSSDRKGNAGTLVRVR